MITPGKKKGIGENLGKLKTVGKGNIVDFNDKSIQRQALSIVTKALKAIGLKAVSGYDTKNEAAVMTSTTGQGSETHGITVNFDKQKGNFTKSNVNKIKKALSKFLNGNKIEVLMQDFNKSDSRRGRRGLIHFKQVKDGADTKDILLSKDSAGDPKPFEKQPAVSPERKRAISEKKNTKSRELDRKVATDFRKELSERDMEGAKVQRSTKDGTMKITIDKGDRTKLTGALNKLKKQVEGKLEVTREVQGDKVVAVVKISNAKSSKEAKAGGSSSSNSVGSKFNKTFKTPRTIINKTEEAFQSVLGEKFEVTGDPRAESLYIKRPGAKNTQLSIEIEKDGSISAKIHTSKIKKTGNFNTVVEGKSKWDQKGVKFKANGNPSKIVDALMKKKGFADFLGKDGAPNSKSAKPTRNVSTSKKITKAGAKAALNKIFKDGEDVGLDDSASRDEVIDLLSKYDPKKSIKSIVSEINKSDFSIYDADSAEISEEKHAGILKNIRKGLIDLVTRSKEHGLSRDQLSDALGDAVGFSFDDDI